MEVAYERLARMTHSDKKQLLGRHLAQRRAICARSIKNNDLRTAAVVMKDEAQLLGLYPATKIAPEMPSRQPEYHEPTNGMRIPLRERLARLVVAHANEDEQEMKEVLDSSYFIRGGHYDTSYPLTMLSILSLKPINEQFESLAFVHFAVWQTLVHGDQATQIDHFAAIHAYWYRVNKDAWSQFCSKLGFDGDVAIKANYRGMAFELMDANLYK